MLPLDGPRWAELKHAYGDASDVPGPFLLKLTKVCYSLCQPDIHE